MRTRRRREEERHDTRPVVILPVGGSVNPEFQTITAGGEEEDKDDGGGGKGEGGSDGLGVGSINVSMIGTVETQHARVCGVRDARRVRRRSLLRSWHQGVLNRRSRR